MVNEVPITDQLKTAKYAIQCDPAVVHKKQGEEMDAFKQSKSFLRPLIYLTIVVLLLSTTTCFGIMMLQYKYELETLREQQKIIVDDDRGDGYQAEMQVMEEPTDRRELLESSTVEQEVTYTAVETTVYLDGLPPVRDERWYNLALRLNKCIYQEDEAPLGSPFILHTPCLRTMLNRYITFEEDLLSNFQFPEFDESNDEIEMPYEEIDEDLDEEDYPAPIVLDGEQELDTRVEIY